MEIRTLRYFMAVANEENITRAAEYLHVSQPTLSRRLMELEKEFGEKLLIRGKRKVTLTDKGILLRSRAQEILDLVDKTVSDMSDDSNSVKGTIHFGAGEADGVRLIMKTAAELQVDYPDIHYNFFSGDAASVIDRNIFCIYNLILNASKIVSEGLGYALALEALIPVDGLSGITSRPIRPAITDRLRIIWKKNQVLTQAAELFLQKLRDNYSLNSYNVSL